MDQIDKQLIETVKSVVNPDIDTTDRDIIVSEYVQSYFGDALNEGVVGGDDIMAAFDELLETADAVREFMVDEGIMDLAKKAAKKTKDIATHPTTKTVLKKTGRVLKKTATVGADTAGATLRHGLPAVGAIAGAAGTSVRKQTGI